MPLTLGSWRCGQPQVSVPVFAEFTIRIMRQHACGPACHLSVWYLLHWMQATVQTLEHSLQQIQAAVARERSALPKVFGVHDEDASFTQAAFGSPAPASSNQR